MPDVRYPDATAQLTVQIRTLRPDQVGWTTHHQTLCHGEAPRPGARGVGPDEPAMAFHLALGEGYTRLFLFREGFLPQELVITDLVGAWLVAGNQRPEDAPGAGG